MNEVPLWKQIQLSIKNNRFDEFVALIEADMSRLQMETVFGPWLHIAADAGRGHIVEWLVEKGVDVSRRGGIIGANALHRAINNGHIEIAKYLRAHGSELDTSAPERNPLYAAIRQSNVVAAEFLIQQGIDIHASYVNPDGEHHNALAYAETCGCSEIAAMLKAAGSIVPENK